TLPWPDRQLHPNARVHYMARARAAKAARSAAMCRALTAGWHRVKLPESGRLHLWLTFYPPDRRRRGDDGPLIAMKAARDGLADAPGIDDHRIVSHPYVHDVPTKGGEVVVRLTLPPGEEVAARRLNRTCSPTT